MEEWEERLTLTERLEDMLAVLEAHTRKTGRRFPPRMLEKLLRYFVRTDLMKQAVLNRAEQLGITGQEDPGVPEKDLYLAGVQALIVGSGLFPREQERRALCLLYGLEEGVPMGAGPVAQRMNMTVRGVCNLDQKFRSFLRRRNTRRKKIKDFYGC